MTFMRPFALHGYEGTLPAGKYELEYDEEVVDGISLPDCLRTSVTIHLQSRTGSSPALAQTLTVPWDALERAQIRDQTPAELSSDMLLAGKLADPIVRLVMLSDGVSVTEVLGVVKAARALNPLQSSCVDPNERARLQSGSSPPMARWISRCDRETADCRATDRAENEGMALLPA